MSYPMFIIAVTILAIMIMVLVVIYWGKRHVPESLVGMYALLYASNAQVECGEMEGSSPQERARKLESKAQYKYGEYPDGMHHGVYRMEDEKEPVD